MSTQATETEAIKRSVTVDCSVEHAFATFTERIHEWWPLAKHSIDWCETGSPADRRSSSRAARAARSTSAPRRARS